jgi:DNA-binding PucR family transcriptional regulator
MSSAAPSPGPLRGRSLVPEPERRRALAGRLAERTATMTTATLSEMDRQHAWFKAMNPEHRSWITLVARAGIDHFVTWFADEADEPPDPVDLFNAAPRQATRRISLHQTVELLKTTIDVVERDLGRMAPDDRDILQTAITHFSRGVAFAAAEVYARAAEQRGDWDTRLEAFVVDSAIRGEFDESMASRAAALGWTARGGRVAVAVGTLPDDPDLMVDKIHSFAAQAHLGALVSPEERRLVAILGGEAITDDASALAQFAAVAGCFGPGPLVVGPVAPDLPSAHLSAAPASSGFRAAAMAPDLPRPVPAGDLLAERVLTGDGPAGRTLVERAIRPLAGADLVTTLAAYLAEGSSVEATARHLYVHPNTVRYRLRRIADLTGLDPAQAKDAFTLNVALRLSRL